MSADIWAAPRKGQDGGSRDVRTSHRDRPWLPVSAFGAWWPVFLAGALALTLYALTLAPGLTWAHDGGDGGDLLAAALTRGVPHPTGYPTYQLLLRVALGLGLGEPARVANWFSAICATIAVALLADLARRTLAGTTGGNLAALGAGLIWAASPALWSQAVITEVYTLNALAVVTLLSLLWRWREALAAGRPGWPWLSATGLALGLGLGNHLTLALTLPGIAAGFWTLRREALDQDRWKAPVLPLAACALGMSVYAYLPWAASADPPVNWGGVTTLGNLWWLVSGTPYRGLILSVPWVYLPGRLAAWGAEAGRQLGGGPWGVLIALLGLWRWERGSRNWWQVTVLVAAVSTIYAIGYNTSDSYVYLIPAWGMASLWFAHGIAWIGDRIAAQGSRRWAVIGMIVLAAALPLVSVVRHWPQMDLSRDRAARSFVEDVLTTAAPQAVILVGEDDPTFALWYARYGLGQRPDLALVNVHLYDYPWYRTSLLHQHPALAELMHDGRQPALAEFVREASLRWPLYRAGSLDEVVVARGAREEPLGALVRISP